MKKEILEIHCMSVICSKTTIQLKEEFHNAFQRKQNTFGYFLMRERKTAFTGYCYILILQYLA